MKPRKRIYLGDHLLFEGIFSYATLENELHCKVDSKLKTIYSLYHLEGKLKDILWGIKFGIYKTTQ